MDLTFNDGQVVEPFFLFSFLIKRQDSICDANSRHLLLLPSAEPVK